MVNHDSQLFTNINNHPLIMDIDSQLLASQNDC